MSDGLQDQTLQVDSWPAIAVAFAASGFTYHIVVGNGLDIAAPWAVLMLGLVGLAYLAVEVLLA